MKLFHGPHARWKCCTLKKAIYLFALQNGATILPFRFFAKLDRLVSPGPVLMSEYVRMEPIRGGDCTEYPNSVVRYPPLSPIPGDNSVHNLRPVIRTPPQINRLYSPD